MTALKGKEETVPAALRIPVSTHKRIKQQMKRHRTTLSDVIRQLIDIGLDQVEAAEHNGRDKSSD